MEKLIKIQNELKAPKNQRNSFGNYNYRNAEDILEALKPLLLENKCLLNLTDEIVLVGSRFYVKATATVIDPETKEFCSSTAFAREEESKKGMDGSQITGASSSYARKYALNGLFLIDDTKDADATNTHDKQEVAEQTKSKPTLLVGSEAFDRCKAAYLKDNSVLDAIKAKYDVPKEVEEKLIK